MHITYKMITELTNLASLVKAHLNYNMLCRKSDIAPEMWIKYFIIVQYQHLYESVSVSKLHADLRVVLNIYYP